MLFDLLIVHIFSTPELYLTHVYYTSSELHSIAGVLRRQRKMTEFSFGDHKPRPWTSHNSFLELNTVFGIKLYDTDKQTEWI